MSHLPAPATIAKAKVHTMEQYATIRCPITGLLLPNAMEPFVGMVLEAYHPIVHNAIKLLDMPGYVKRLDKEHRIGLIFASLEAMRKLIFQGDALVLLGKAQCTLTDWQVNQVLEFISGQMRNTRKSYPKFRATMDLSDESFDEYIKLCNDVESYTGIDPLEEKLAAIRKEEASERLARITTIIPASATRQAKNLNKDCSEAFTECKPFLSKTTIAAAKPILRELATLPNDALVGKFVAKVSEAASEYADFMVGPEGQDALAAAAQFAATVKENRAKALAAGLQKSELDELEDALDALPAAKEPPATESSMLDDILAAVTTPTTPEAQAATLSFSERMKLRKAGGK